MYHPGKVEEVHKLFCSADFDTDPRCCVQYDIGMNHLVYWGDKEAHSYRYGRPVCLKHFGLGVAWQGELIAGILALLISIDTYLALTTYATKATEGQKQQADNWLVRARQTQKEKDKEGRLLEKYDIIASNISHLDEALAEAPQDG